MILKLSALHAVINTASELGEYDDRTSRATLDPYVFSSLH